THTSVLAHTPAADQVICNVVYAVAPRPTSHPSGAPRARPVLVRDPSGARPPPRPSRPGAAAAGPDRGDPAPARGPRRLAGAQRLRHDPPLHRPAGDLRGDRQLPPAVR